MAQFTCGHISLQEQVETYSHAAEEAEEKVKQLTEELVAEKQARATETSSLQSAIQEQSREIKDLESKIESMDSTDSTNHGGGGGGDLQQELLKLKTRLESEVNERKRTTILLNMLNDHNERLTSLNEAALSSNTPHTGIKSHTLSSSSTSSPMLEYISYFGFLMALFGCVWALSSSSGGSNSRFRRSKDTSHIV
mmetsp:Transcript_29992/g.38715  ORF Transcript_29992/g.38715 Transcript_29992/m.38715 type:complete len:195 (-) Transcript_29992:109-693(-)